MSEGRKSFKNAPLHGNMSRLFTSAPCFAFTARIFDFLFSTGNEDLLPK